MIVLRQVCKRFAGKPILSDVSLQLAAGQIHVLLGSSGSGKTTILRMIAGVLPPDSGSVLVEDVLVVPKDPNPLADTMGYMMQEGSLFPHFTAGDNVTLMARVRGIARAAIDARLHELATLVGLDEALLSRHPAQLSGGQRQRVALMRALFLKPKYLLLDEPLGALDPIIRCDLQATLKSVFETLRTTVILVTHDIGEAAFFGDTVTLLHEGAILQHGSFRELVQSPSHPYVTTFLQAQRPVPQLKVFES